MDEIAVPAALVAAAPLIAGVVQLLKRLGWVDAYPKVTALVLGLAVSIAWAVKMGDYTEEGITQAVVAGVALGGLVATSGAVLTYEALKPIIDALLSRKTETP